MRSYQLPSIEYLKLRFHLEAQLDCRLSSWKGSLLRGAFGHALRRTVCTMRRGQQCDDCMLRSQCAYTRLFETFANGAPPPFINKDHNSPRPFIFEPSDDGQGYQPGDIVWFDIALIGNSIDYLPYVIFAIYQMGKYGLGVNRYPFELKQVFCQQCQDVPSNENDRFQADFQSQHQWHLIYDGADQKILFNPKALTLQNSSHSDDAPASIKLNFLTQTRLVFGHQLSTEFSFRQLVFKLLRRTLELAHFYTPDQTIIWEFHEYLQAANQVLITRSNLHWKDQTRYSNRQKTKLKLGGFVGDLTLEGELAPFMDLLSYAEILHVGKGATFGLGKVEVKSV